MVQAARRERLEAVDCGVSSKHGPPPQVGNAHTTTFSVESMVRGAIRVLRMSRILRNRSAEYARGARFRVLRLPRILEHLLAERAGCASQRCEAPPRVLPHPLPGAVAGRRAHAADVEGQRGASGV